jgi:dihydrofolate reductase
MEVILIAAVTLDGFIARSRHEVSTDWTSKEDRAWFAKKTKEIGTCIMGRTTFETIGRPLPERQIIELSMTGYPIDTLKIGDKGSVITTDSSPVTVIDHLRKSNVNSVAVCGGASIYSQFLREKLVDRLLLTVEPVLFGQGIKILSQPMDLRLKQVDEFKLSETAFVREYHMQK